VSQDAFDYHKPTEAQLATITRFREHAKAFRDSLNGLPPSRESSLALTNIEQALMWANKAAVKP
jgi:hypothetical protein